MGKNSRKHIHQGRGRPSGSLSRGWPERSRRCREAASKGPGVVKIFGHGCLMGEPRGRKREGGCVILHPDGWFQQQPRQVNTGAEARQGPPPPAGSVLVTTLVKA